MIKGFLAAGSRLSLHDISVSHWLRNEVAEGCLDRSLNLVSLKVSLIQLLYIKTKLAVCSLSLRLSLSLTQNHL